mgnify:CR=1 FL=1
MKTLKEKIEVMQACLAGKEIEYFGSTKTWTIATHPCWDWEDFDYRIKPENKQVPYDFSDAESLIGRKLRREDGCISIISSVYHDEVTVFARRHLFEYVSENFEIWNNTLNRWESCTKTVKG